MRIETTYYADDGEEFYTEEACLAYEESCRKQMSSVLFFNKEFKPLLTTDEIENGAWYAYIKDVDMARSLFNWLNDLVGLEIPGCEFAAGDVLGTDDEHYKWVNLTHRLAEVAQMMEAVGMAIKFYGQAGGG